jgi:ankyrin repeat protein
MWASQEGHTEIVELLLQNGADVHQLNYLDESCIGLATARGHHEIAELLLEYGANVPADTSRSFHE